MYDKQHNHQESDVTRRWWQSPLFGYPGALVLTACAFLIPFTEGSMGIRDFFVVPPFVIATLIAGWLWGMGPALLALALEILALDYWIIPPLGSFSFFRWPDLASFLPFILIQLLVLILVVKQKEYRQHLLFTHKALAENNQRLAESNAQLDKANQDLAQSNEQLEHANQVKEIFLSRASHELKTPLTTIQSQAQLALRRLSRLAELPFELTFLPDHLNKISQQTHRLHALVNDLLNLSSLRAGRMPLRAAPCDFLRLCADIIAEQSALAERQVNFTSPRGPLILQIDEGRLGQVITNLLTNAFKYSPADSAIDASITQDTGRVTLAVHNEGPAIPQEQQCHLFEPFYRTPDAQSSTAQGWGLGLSISKEIVEQHGGHIWIVSQEHNGTTFHVALPAHT